MSTDAILAQLNQALAAERGAHANVLRALSLQVKNLTCKLKKMERQRDEARARVAELRGHVTRYQRELVQARGTRAERVADALNELERTMT